MSNITISPSAGAIAAVGLAIALSFGSNIVNPAAAMTMAGVASKQAISITPQSGSLLASGIVPRQGIVSVIPAGSLTLAGYANASGSLFVTEFEGLSNLSGPQSGMLIPHCPSLADQIVTYGNASCVSSPFGNATRIIRVHTDSNCIVKIGGKAPIALGGATGGGARMAANQTEYYSVKPGDRVAVITVAK